MGAGYAGSVDYDWAHNDYNTHFDHGYTFMVSAGFRFTDWFSLNLEQSLQQQFYAEGCHGGTGNHCAHLEDGYLIAGTTSATVKFLYLNDSRNFELYFKLGVGVGYFSEHFCSDALIDDIDIQTYVDLVASAGIGMNVYFTELLGMGLDIQYDWMPWTGIQTLKTIAHLAVRF